MSLIRSLTLLACGLGIATSAYAQQFDDIYYDASKDKKTTAVAKKKSSAPAVVVASYPAADTYTVSGTRSISVDDYNRRGIFASDSLTSDTTKTDFAYTRRIEQFYNPEIVSGSGDQELAQIYYMEPDQVNIYVNTPSAYWGYDYFYPSIWGTPYWAYNSWRWNSPWYWNSWYDPYWAWGPSWSIGWGWGPSWGPSWAWGPGYWGPGYWGPGWIPGPPSGPGHNPGWGGRPYNPRHPGALANSSNGSYGGRPSSTVNGGRRPGANYRPTTGTSTGTTSNRRPAATTNRRPSSTNSNSGYTPSNNSNYTPSTTTNGGRRQSSGYNSGGSRGSYGGSSGGSYGGGRSSGGRSSGGGRGRH